MTRRVLLAALAATLAFPAAARAQFGATAGEVLFRGPHLQVTPFLGYLTGVNRIEDWSYTDASGSYHAQADLDVGGATMVGLSFEAPLAGNFGLTAAGGYGARDATVFRVLQNGEYWAVEGPHVLLGRLGVAFHLPPETSEFVLRRLGASAHVGATVLHERARHRVGSAELEDGTHFGANLGVSATVPFAGDRFAVQLGLEDNMIWWNQRALASLPYEYFDRPGDREQTVASVSMSHVWLLRAGLSMRLR